MVWGRQKELATGASRGRDDGRNQDPGGKQGFGFLGSPAAGSEERKRCLVGSTTWAIAGLPETLAKEQADLAVIMPTTAKVPVWRAIHESQVNPNQGF